MKSVADQWIRFRRTGERFKNTSVGLIADLWPTIGEAYRFDHDPYDPNNVETTADDSLTTNWYPTLVLNLEIKRSLPEEGIDWLFARVRSREIENGRMDVEVTIMDSAGRLIAQSQQVCFVLPGSRLSVKPKEQMAKESKNSPKL